jgi:hypothetical protein
MARIHNPYGDGHASGRIRQAMEAYFGGAASLAVIRPGAPEIAEPVTVI